MGDLIHVDVPEIQVVVPELSEQVAVRLLETSTVETEKVEHIVIEEVRAGVQVIAVGAQGPAGQPGDQGPPGSSEATLKVYQNAFMGSLMRGMPVAIHNQTFVKPADATDSALKYTVGLVFDEAVLVSAPATVVVSGPLVATTAEWDFVTGQSGGLTPGAPYFLSNVAGRMLTVAPVSGYNQKLGVALTSTEFLVRIEPPIQL